MTPRSISEPLPPPHNALQRHLPGTPHLRSRSMNLSPHSSTILRRFSPRCHLTHCRTASHGITLLSWSSEQRHPPPRCTHYLRMNRRSWTPSLRRIWHRVGSVPPSPRWQLRYSASRKVMSGRPHSAQTEDFLNPWSCSSASPTARPLSRP